MRVRWRELFSSKIAGARRWDRWDWVALALAVFIVLCVFALKLKTFYDLGYSEDLFASLQAARSWLEGKGLLRDNWAGNVLAVHTYFLLLPLGLIAKPFGAPGLLFVLAASVGVTYFWATRILRLLGVAGLFAVVLAAVVLASPISVFFYQEWYHGFHVEDLAPALCLLLFYFLLQRRLIPSIVTALPPRLTGSSPFSTLTGTWPLTIKPSCSTPNSFVTRLQNSRSLSNAKYGFLCSLRASLSSMK